MIQRYRMVIEGFGCETRGLNICSIFMTELVNTLATLEIGRIQINVLPKMILNTKRQPAAPGVTILVEYLESGAGLRTWPEEEFASLDIFSCKKFTRMDVIKAFKAFFHPKSIEVNGCCKEMEQTLEKTEPGYEKPSPLDIYCAMHKD